MEVDTATRGDADAVAATFGAAMAWLPGLRSDTEDRQYFAEHVIGKRGPRRTP